MSRTVQEKYEYFTVGLITDSFALEALWGDALKHHMTEHLGQLIALRLTEYYELMTQRAAQPIGQVPPLVKPSESVEAKDWGSKQTTGSVRSISPDSEDIIFASPAADQNADEAADYWSTL